MVAVCAVVSLDTGIRRSNHNEREKTMLYSSLWLGTINVALPAYFSEISSSCCLGRPLAGTGDHDQFCLRREPNHSKFRDDGTTAKHICNAHKSGSYVFNTDQTICWLKNYDVKRGGGRCQSHVDVMANKGTKFNAGTPIQTLIEFDLYRLVILRIWE